MRLQITSARFSVTDAQKRVEMARNALSQAKENLKISNDQYQVGMETSLPCWKHRHSGKKPGASGSMRKPCYT